MTLKYIVIDLGLYTARFEKQHNATYLWRVICDFLRTTYGSRCKKGRYILLLPKGGTGGLMSQQAISLEFKMPSSS